MSKAITKLIHPIIIVSILVACGNSMPNEEDVAKAWQVNNEANAALYDESAVKNLKCSMTGDGLTTCDYSLGKLHHNDMFVRAGLGTWELSSNKIVKPKSN